MPIGIAFLGCGFATRLHSRTLRGVDGVRRYYASRSMARASEYNEKWKGSGAFGAYDAALAHPDVDVVLIATPPALHEELTVAALQAGKHVIVEKPPFTSVEILERMMDRAEAADRRLFVAENYFYKPMLREIRSAIASHVIGDVRILNINALKEQKTEDWRDQPSEALGGAMFEGGIHWVSFMANLGLTVRGVRGYAPGAHGRPDRTMVTVWDYEEADAVGTLFYSWEIGSPTRGLRLSAIYGSDGAITFESNGLFLAVRGRQKRIAVPNPTDLLGYGAMFRDFFSAIEENRPAEYDRMQARRDLSLVEQIYRSAGLPLPGSSTADRFRG